MNTTNSIYNKFLCLLRVSRVQLIVLKCLPLWNTPWKIGTVTPCGTPWLEDIINFMTLCEISSSVNDRIFWRIMNTKPTGRRLNDSPRRVWADNMKSPSCQFSFRFILSVTRYRKKKVFLINRYFIYKELIL